MAKLKFLSNVNVGLVANDGTGDLLRDAFIKVNTGLNSLYNNGQISTYWPDTKLTPGFTWDDSKNTGIYRPAKGKIGFTINGNDTLILSDDGDITWFASKLATETYVESRLSTVTGVISGGPPGSGPPGGPGGPPGGPGEIPGDGSTLIPAIPVVDVLPTAGNYEGRFVLFNGDVWIFTCYPPGNGAGLPANPEIAREAGSDCRWTRFRGDGAVTVGNVRPDTGVEGQTFYEASTNTLYLFVNGQWKTYASVLTPDAPAGLEVLSALPSVSDPKNFEGRTVVVGNSVSIFINGQWQSLSQYLTPAASGAVPSGNNLPSTSGAAKGDLFRKTGTNAGLYIFDGATWKTIEQYTEASKTAGIRTLPSLPTNLSAYNVGDLIIVSNNLYILTENQQGVRSWAFFNPSNASGGIITAVSVTAGSIGAAEIAAGAVTADKIAAGAVVSGKIAAGAISANEIAAGAITADKIGAGAIIAGKIAAGAIGANQIAAGAISADKLAAGSVTAGKLAVGAISAENIQATSLAVISQNAGTITAGVLRSGDNKMIIDLNNKFIKIEL